MATGFLDRLGKAPILLDGAMGSLLMARGLTSGDAPERWNVERPNEVRRVHRSYFEAGADVVTTNTFGGSPLRLASKGLADRAGELNRAGVELARSARSGKGWVAGDIGPTGRVTGLPGAVSAEELRDTFAQQADALAGAGADLLIVETMYDLDEALAAVGAAVATGLPVVATMTFDRKPRGFFTLMGHRPGPSLAALEQAGAAAVGANCTLGPEDMVDLVGAMRPETRLPLLAQANAGQPVLVGGEATYPVGPEAFAAAVLRMLDAGADLVGGCCGTTPEHIRRVRAVIGRGHADHRSG